MVVKGSPNFLICDKPLRHISLENFRYVPNPVLVIIDVQPKELGIPSKAYYAIEEVKEVKPTSPLPPPFSFIFLDLPSVNPGPPINIRWI
jgi:hypothetical protein